MNVDKMRRQLARNQDNYAWRRLATNPPAPIPPVLQRLAESMAALSRQPIRLRVPPGPP